MSIFSLLLFMFTFMFYFNRKMSVEEIDFSVISANKACCLQGNLLKQQKRLFNL